MVDLVAFELAGTTVRDDGVVARALQMALGSVGVHPSDSEAEKWLGYPRGIAIRALLTLARGVAPAPSEVDRLHRQMHAWLVRFYATDPTVTEVAGARRTFAELRRLGVRVGITTAFDRVIARVVLERLGWLVGRDLDAVVTSDQVERPRPRPDMIHLLMDRCGVHEPGLVVKVGDTPADMLEGKGARCRYVVGVETGGASARHLWEAGATHVAASLADLPELLRSPATHGRLAS